MNIGKIRTGRTLLMLVGAGVLILCAYGLPFFLYEGGLRGFMQRSSFAVALPIVWLAGLYFIWLYLNVAYCVFARGGWGLRIEDGGLVYLARTWMSLRLTEIRQVEIVQPDGPQAHLLVHMANGRQRHLPMVLFQDTPNDLARKIRMHLRKRDGEQGPAAA
jgi:hypothetical protein